MGQASALWRDVNTGRGAEFVLMFGGEEVRFDQQGDGTHVDLGGAWPTGLYLMPEHVDLTEDVATPDRFADPVRRELYESLAELGRRWAEEHDVFAEQDGCERFAVYPHWHRREGELRDVFDSFVTRCPGRIVSGTGVIGI